MTITPGTYLYTIRFNGSNVLHVGTDRKELIGRASAWLAKEMGCKS
jgi:hypothetical protein